MTAIVRLLHFWRQQFNDAGIVQANNAEKITSMDNIRVYDMSAYIHVFV